MLPLPLDVLLLDPAQAVGGSLSSLGHRPFAAAGVDALLTMIVARPFDAVVVAGASPAATTMAAAAVARVRAAERSHVALTPVIAVVPPALAEALAAAGADEVVDWPVNVGRLAAVLGALSPDQSLEVSLEVNLGNRRAAEILRLFLTTLEDLTAALRLDGSDAGALEQVAHRIKGAAANIGYPDLAATAAAATAAANAGGKAETAARAVLIAALEETHGAVCERLATLSVLEDAS